MFSAVVTNEMASSGVEDLELSGSENGSGVAEGYDIQLFVELPPKDLICTKCEKVLREPHQAECGHLYCGQCISATEDSPCHCCGRNLRPRACSKDYQRDRRILELRVRCPERGCQWEGELQDSEIHRKEQCAYRVVECEFRYAGCMASGTASEMKEHLESDTQQHLCLVAKYFQTQLEQLQTERSVAATAGTPQGEVEEGERHQHERRAGSGGMDQQEGQGEERWLHISFCGLLIAAAVLVAMLAIAYQLGVSSLHNSDDVTRKLENLQAHLDEIKKMEDSRSHNWSTLESEYVKLSNQFKAFANSTETSMVVFQNKFREILSQVHEQNRIMNEEKVKSNNRETQIKKVNKTLTVVERKVDSIDFRTEKIEAEGLHTSEISATYRILPLEIAIPVSQPAVWQSAPFYTHLQGYKMHVLINTSSHVRSDPRQERFSVYLQIEPGEFDGSLRWPTDLELTVHLLHPKGDHYQPEKSVRLMVFPNGLSGWDEYIAQKNIAKYITNNLLHFKIFKLL